MKRNGFTLLEMLTLIGLFSTLMAILSPLLSQARCRAQETSCLARLHQIYLGFRLADDDLPDSDLEDIQPFETTRYVPAELWKCPLSSPGDPDCPWDGIERVPRPTGSEMWRVTADAPFLEGAVHHRVYDGPWLIVAGNGSARMIRSECRPWYEKNEAGD
jgi:hypothetical protein